MKDNTEAPVAASDDGGKDRRSGTDAASRKFGISESEARRTAFMGFDSPTLHEQK